MDEDESAGNSNGALIEAKEFNLENEPIRNHYRSYEQLKEELGEFTPKSDAELLTSLLQEYKNLSKTNEGWKYKQIAILEDLDYLAHQYDNALEFVRQGGFKEVILKNLNSTDSETLQNTLRLLGSLTQSNPKVQIHALESGCIEALSRVLQGNSDHVVKNRAIFALSSLLRHFPLAQIEFINKGGLGIISKQFDLRDTKLQLKLATFITDLLQEYDEAIKDTNNPDYLKKVDQYVQVNLRPKLSLINWCQNLNNLLFSVVIIDRYDHDAIEKTLMAIMLVADTCTNAVRDVIDGLEKQYADLALSEKETDEYFKKMRKLCWDIINKINNSNHTEF